MGQPLFIRMKKVQLTFTSPTTCKRQFNHELKIQAQLSHDNIVKLLGVILQPKPALGILMELVERGDLRNVQGIYGSHINWQFRIKLLLDAALGIKYLHQLTPPVVHGDLKSDNLLVTNEFIIKLCDFGSSAKEGVDYGRRMPFTYQFIPPEAWEQGKQYKPKTTFDVYSFAIIMLEVLSGEIPYGDLEAEMVEWHVSMIGNRLPLDDMNAPSEIVSLIDECWQQEPDQRPCLRDITKRLRTVIRNPLVAEEVQHCCCWLKENPRGPPDMRPYLSTPQLKQHWISTDEQLISSLSMLYSELFVVFRYSSVIKVFNTELKNIRNITVKEMEYPQDITTCRTNKWLYILDWIGTVWCVDSVRGDVVRQWQASGRPTSVNINNKSNILLSCFDGNIINEYQTTGEIIKQIKLTDTTEKLKEKLKQWRDVGKYERREIKGLLSVNDEFMICLEFYNTSGDTFHYFVCHLSCSGELLHCFPDPQQSPFNAVVKDTTEWLPESCTLDDRQQLIVSDRDKDRVVLFTDKSLFSCSQLIDLRQVTQQFNSEEDIRWWPSNKVYFNRSTGLLFVGRDSVLLSYQLM